MRTRGSGQSKWEGNLWRGGGAVMQYPVVLHQDDVGGYVVECPIIPGCISEGETVDEALSNIQEAIEGLLEVRRQQGLPDTLEWKYVDVKHA